MRYVCRDRVIVGIGRPGGFGERVAVPAAALRPMPASLSWDTAAMAEPAANAVHAWAVGGGEPGLRVAVLGCGAIGLLCLLAARAGGAASVDVTDLSAARLAVAGSLGAARTGATLEGEYDLVIDAAGTVETHVQSVQHQRPGGAAVWLGLADREAGFDAQALIRAEKRILASFGYTDEDFDRAVGLIGGWDLSWTSAFPLADGAQVFTELMNGALEPVKALLHPGDAARP